MTLHVETKDNLERVINSLSKENTLLARKLFNSEQHYELLKQSYDNVFAYLAETNNSTTFLEFNKFMEWIRKPTPEIDKDIEDESVSAYELFMKKNPTKKEEKDLPYVDSHC